MKDEDEKEKELLRVEMMRLQNAVVHLQRSKLELEEAIREEGDGTESTYERERERNRHEESFRDPIE